MDKCFLGHATHHASTKQRIYPENKNDQTDKPAENKKATSGDLKYFGVLLALSQALIECLL
ncbi:hypothetical protein EYZ01_09920 [Hafnia alvei]|uniref:Uncharacterized protein n=1 Tax=Hafnia alvei ATCC 51873 TaxID=1002364 RepID=G9YBG2_HAFAL|nr:hypothetical protein [Hafnia alvei]EHM39318.1 hypothetical protein HMPREF0454_03942 [Hafnia alvei ATCC 51873]TBL39323.1 hypothetical protein EYZ01_09920 [Hafnia alvei]